MDDTAAAANSNGDIDYNNNRDKCNPEHPVSRLGIGNLKTLKDWPLAAGYNIREELLAFHKVRELFRNNTHRAK